jgi:hypothetical protein
LPCVIKHAHPYYYTGILIYSVSDIAEVVVVISSILIMTDTATNLAAASLTFSVLSFIVLVVGVVSWSFGDWSKLTQKLGVGSGSSSFNGFKTFAVMSGAVAPDVALLVGFLSDIMNFKFRYSVTSLVGIIAALLSSALMYIRRALSGKSSSPAAAAAAASATAAVASALTPPPAPPAAAAKAFDVGVGTVGGRRMKGGLLPQYVQDNYNPCTIRGMGFLEVPGSNMGIAALAAIFAVYILDMTQGSKRSSPEIGGYLAFALVIFGLNLYASSELKCVSEANGGWMSYAIALALGLGVGGAAYMVLQTNYPDFLPLDPTNIEPTSPANMSRCGKPNDKDQFVCAAYKDGKPITSPSVVS